MALHKTGEVRKGLARKLAIRIGSDDTKHLNLMGCKPAQDSVASIGRGDSGQAGNAFDEKRTQLEQHAFFEEEFDIDPIEALRLDAESLRKLES